MRHFGIVQLHITSTNGLPIHQFLVIHADGTSCVSVVCFFKAKLLQQIHVVTLYGIVISQVVCYRVVTSVVWLSDLSHIAVVCEVACLQPAVQEEWGSDRGQMLEANNAFIMALSFQIMWTCVLNFLSFSCQ